MTKFKKGQKAKVVLIDSDDIKIGIKAGEIVTVDEDGTTVPYVIRADGSRVVLMEHQMEHYTAHPETLTINGVEYIRKPEPEHEWEFGDVAEHEEYGVVFVGGESNVKEGSIWVVIDKGYGKHVSPKTLTFLRRADLSA